MVERKLSASERLERLEQFAGEFSSDVSRRFEGLVGAVSKSFGEVTGGLNGVGEILDSLVAVLAEADPDLNEKIKAHLEQKKAEAAAIEKARLRDVVDSAKEEGVLVAKGEDGTVDEDSFVVMTEYLDAFKEVVIPPGIIATVVGAIGNPEVGPALEGKKVGDTVELSSGHVLEINELYTVVAQEPEASDETPVEE